jgi:hypothetical protein
VTAYALQPEDEPQQTQEGSAVFGYLDEPFVLKAPGTVSLNGTISAYPGTPVAADTTQSIYVYAQFSYTDPTTGQIENKVYSLYGEGEIPINIALPVGAGSGAFSLEFSDQETLVVDSPYGTDSVTENYDQYLSAEVTATIPITPEPAPALIFGVIFPAMLTRRRRDSALIGGEGVCARQVRGVEGVMRSPSN